MIASVVNRLRAEYRHILLGEPFLLKILAFPFLLFGTIVLVGFLKLFRVKEFDDDLIEKKELPR